MGIIKILVLSQYWLPENGVPQRRWAWLTRILQRNGHEVVVVCPPAHYERSVSIREWLQSARPWNRFKLEKGPNEETVVRTGYFPVGRSLSSRILNQAAVALSMMVFPVRIPKELKHFSPDLVIGTVPALPTSVVTRAIAKKYRKPYVIDLRDAWPALLNVSDDWNSATGAPSLRERIARHGFLQSLSWLTEQAMNRVLKKADGIITTSERLEEWLRIEHESSTQSMTTIRNVFPPRTTDRKRGVQDNTEPLRVLYAGTLGRAQKLGNALEAARLAQDTGVPVKLRFVGDGAAWNELHDLAEKLGVDVEFRHRAAAEDLEEHYEWADTALVHLARWEPLTRTIPSKTYELMSIGLHISAAVEGECADLIEDLDAGHVVTPEAPEELAELWAHLSAERSLLNTNRAGKNWVKNERDEVVPQRLLDFIAGIASED